MAAVSEQTTAFALAEKSKLIKSLRRFDMVFFTVCAFVGLDTLGTVANNGPEGFFWLIVLAIVCVSASGVRISSTTSSDESNAFFTPSSNHCMPGWSTWMVPNR